MVLEAKAAMAISLVPACAAQAVLLVSGNRVAARKSYASVRLACGLPSMARSYGLVHVKATSQVETTPASTSKPTVPDTEVSITKTSFGTIGLTLGSALLAYGFGAYFTILPGSEWSAIMLTYGFPIAIIGFALKYAELKPVPCLTYLDAFNLRESQATPILQQVRSDVTRYRYGDEQHLEEALKRIFRYGQSGGIQRRNAPFLQSIREEVNGEGRYTLVLVFAAKALKLSDFEDRQAKFTSFFGPGVKAEIVDGASANMYEVRLVSGDNAAVST